MHLTNPLILHINFLGNALHVKWKILNYYMQNFYCSVQVKTQTSVKHLKRKKGLNVSAKLTFTLKYDMFMQQQHVEHNYATR